MGGDSTTQSTSIPPPTPEETALMNDVTQNLMPSYLQSLGYNVQTNTTTFQQSPDYQTLTNAVQQAQDALVQAQANPSQSQNVGGGGKGSQTNVQAAQAQLANAQAQLSNAQANFKPQTTYTTTKVAGPEAQAALAQYGADSPQYAAAQQQDLANNASNATSQEDVDKSILANTQNFVSGNFALTPSEQQYMSTVMGPMQQAASNAVSMLQSNADQIQGSNQEAINTAGSSVAAAIGQFTDQVQQTGLNMNDALNVLATSVNNTGVGMQEALDNQVQIASNLNSMQLQDFTTQQKASIAMQAAQMGRSPTDPGFQEQLQTLVDRQTTEANLQLGEYAAGQSENIASQTGQGLQNVTQQRVNTAQQVGQGMQTGAQTGITNAQQIGSATIANTQGANQIRTQAAQLGGTSGQNIASYGANLSNNLAINLPQSEIGTGTNTANFITAQNQQAISNNASAMNAPLGIYNTLYQQNYAQPTSTTQQSSGLGSWIGGAIGMGLNGLATAGKVGLI